MVPFLRIDPPESADSLATNTAFSTTHIHTFIHISEGVMYLAQQPNLLHRGSVFFLVCARVCASSLSLCLRLQARSPLWLSCPWTSSPCGPCRAFLSQQVSRRHCLLVVPSAYVNTNVAVELDTHYKPITSHHTTVGKQIQRPFNLRLAEHGRNLQPLPRGGHQRLGSIHILT